MSEGIRLTAGDRCQNGLCQRPVILELCVYPRDVLCHDCSPIRLIEERADGGKTYQFGDGLMLSHDGAGRCLRYERVPFRLDERWIVK